MALRSNPILAAYVAAPSTMTAGAAADLLRRCGPMIHGGQRYELDGDGKIVVTPIEPTGQQLADLANGQPLHPFD
jgi:hypothetical protein